MDLRRLEPRPILPADLAAIEDPRLLRLAEYWLAKRAGRVVTRRADIDPMEMKWILPHVVLYDVEPDTGRLRCRLAGEEVRAMYATNIVGRYLDEYVLAKGWKVIEAHHRAMIEQPAIGYAKGQVYRAALEQYGHGERIGLPLSDEEGAQVTVMLGATIYRPLPGANDLTVQREGMERMLIPLSAEAVDQA